MKVVLCCWIQNDHHIHLNLAACKAKTTMELFVDDRNMKQVMQNDHLVTKTPLQNSDEKIHVSTGVATKSSLPTTITT